VYKTLEEFVDALRPYIPLEIVSETALKTLRSLTHDIPGELAELICFETRLNTEADKDRADLIFLVDRHQRNFVANADFSTFKNPIWLRLQRLARLLADPTSPLFDGVTDFWIEFDGVADRLTVPSMYLTLPIPADSTYMGGLSYEFPSWVFDTALPILMDRDLPTLVRQQLEQCIAALPPKSVVLHVGMMLGRGDTRVRLVILGLDNHSLRPYLDRIGWQGSTTVIEGLYDCYSGFVDQICHYIDVGETISPYLGIDFQLNDIFSRQQRRWESLIDQLVADKWCTSEKATAFLASFGGTQTHVMYLSNPIYLLRMPMLTKFNYYPNQPLESKGYLLCRQQDRDRIKSM
jgi:hypothetical protein